MVAKWPQDDVQRHARVGLGDLFEERRDSWLAVPGKAELDDLSVPTLSVANRVVVPLQT
jgi:hypothetical protein